MFVCWLKDQQRITCSIWQWHVRSMHQKCSHFEQKIYFPSIHIFVHALCSSWPKEIKKLLSPSMYAKRQCNSIPLPWNLSDILMLPVKFTDIYWHFWQITNKSLTFSTGNNLLYIKLPSQDLSHAKLAWVRIINTNGTKYKYCIWLLLQSSWGSWKGGHCTWY